MMTTKLVSWKIWCSLWLNTTSPWGLLNPFGSRDLHVSYARRWSSLTRGFWWMKFYLNWWKRLWLFMCNLTHAQPHAHLSYWRQKGRMTFVVVVNFLFNKSEAKHVIIKLFEVNDTSSEAMVPRLNIFPLLIISLFTSRMRGQVCQCFEFGCFMCQFGYVRAIWWIMFWACPIKGLPTCDYGWESSPWIVLHIHKDCSNW